MSARFPTVVFDWYATLASPSATDWWAEMFDLMATAGAELTDEAITRWASPPTDHLRHSTDEASYRDYERHLLEQLLTDSGIDASAQRSLSEEILALRDLETVGIYPDVVPFLDELHDANVRIALCSNWSWDLLRHLEHNGVANYFDTIICSATVGYRKPHPVIFETLLAELGSPPGEVAFIGDDWTADIEGAKSMGLTPFHLARESCSVERHDPIACARTLVDLRPLLL